MMRQALALLFSLLALPLMAETAEGVFPEAMGDAAKPVWRMALGGAVTGLPMVQAGTVVVVLDGGHIKTFSLDGKLLWEFYARGKLAPYITRSREGTCYIYRTDGTLITLNRAGRELWRLRPEPVSKTAEAPALEAPILSGWDGRIFLPAGSSVYCYTASGQRLWKAGLPSRPVWGPELDASGGMVAALESGDLAEISPSGKVQLRSIGETPAAVIPVEQGSVVLLKRGAALFFPLAMGRTATPIRLPSLGASPLSGISRGNSAAVLLSNGKVALLSLDERKILWTGETHVRSGEIKQGEKDKVRLLFDERGVYVFTSGGASGFSPDGRRLWVLRLKGAASVPALSGDGRLFSGGADWILYAYRLEDRVLRERNSLYGPLPEGSYGFAPPSPWAGFDYNYSEAELNKRLAEINERIAAGNVGEDEAAYTAYLMEVSGCMLGPGVQAARPLAQVAHRAQAALLLGGIGSRETIPFLSTLFLKDPDPSVKTAAATAIGRIGVDPDGVALKAFAQAVNGGEEQVLTAAASSIGALCRFSGPPLSDSGVRLLNLLSGGTMPPRTRAQAVRELDGLRQQ